MNATRKTTTPKKITVTTDELQEMLGCGRESAVRVGESAEARVKIGRRVLWNLSKIQSYIDNMSY